MSEKMVLLYKSRYLVMLILKSFENLFIYKLSLNSTTNKHY